MYIIVPLLSLCVPLILCLQNKTSIPEKVDISAPIKEISMTYPIRNEAVWDYLQSGIERLINEEKEPATFVLVQWLAKNDTAHKIAFSAGDIVAKHLG